MDDMVLDGKDEGKMKHVKEELSSRFDIKDLGKLGYFLGMSVVQDQEKKETRIGQPSYVHKKASDQDGDERLQADQDPCGSRQLSRECDRGRGSTGPAVISVTGRKSDISSHMYEARHRVCCGNFGQVFKQTQPNSLCSSKTSVVIPKSHFQPWNYLQGR